MNHFTVTSLRLWAAAAPKDVQHWQIVGKNLGLAVADKTAVIPPRTDQSSSRDYDRELCAARHLIENFCAKIKQFRASATRHEKTARSFLAAVQLVACVVWLH